MLSPVPTILGGKRKKKKGKKVVIKKKTKRTKVKIKIKGSPVGVHNAISKLAGNGPSGSGDSTMKVKFDDEEK